MSLAKKGELGKMRQAGTARGARSNLFLQPLDFIADAFDLIVFLGAFERVAEARQGAIGFAGLLVGVAQMLDDRRIVGGQLHRPLKLFHRSGIVATLIIDPAKTIDIESVDGLNLKRALN